MIGKIITNRERNWATFYRNNYLMAIRNLESVTSNVIIDGTSWDTHFSMLAADYIRKFNIALHIPMKEQF